MYDSALLALGLEFSSPRFCQHMSLLLRDCFWPIMVATGWNKLTVQAGDICHAPEPQWGQWWGYSCQAPDRMERRKTQPGRLG